MSFSEEKSKNFYEAAKGNLELVKTLSLDPEVNLNWKNGHGDTPFSQACTFGHVAIVRYLLDYNQRQIDYNLADKWKQSPFSWACGLSNEKVVEKLLADERIDVNKADNVEKTPLWRASSSGHLGVVKVMLASARQIDTLKKDKEGRTPAEIARNPEKRSSETTKEFQARKDKCPRVAELLESFERDPQRIKAQLRKELGYPDQGPKLSTPARRQEEERGPKRKRLRTYQGKQDGEEQQQKRSKLMDQITKADPRKSFENFQSMSKCSICLNSLRNPKTLPCVHSFCLECLEKQIRSVNAPHHCGLCRAPFDIPEDGLISLETSPLLADLLSASSSASSSTSIDPNDVKCDLCEGGEDARFHCGECRQFLGSQCVGFHRRISATQHHQLQPIDEYFAKTGGKRAPIKRVSRCQKHPALEVDTYCKTCNVIVCSKCAVETHSGHQFCSMSEETGRLKKELIEMTTTIAVREKEAEITVGTFVQSLGEFGEKRKKAGEKLSRAFASIHEDLDRREAEMLGKLEDGAAAVQKAVELEKEEVVFALTEFKGYREMNEAVLIGGSDVEMARGHSMLMARGKTLDEIGYLLEPSRADIDFDPEDLDVVKKAISSFGKIA